MDATNQRIQACSNLVDRKKAAEIAAFSKTMKSELDALRLGLDRLNNQMPRIQNSVSKSNPDCGLDPQMESLITMFANRTEEIYSEAGECCINMKEFESSIQEAKYTGYFLSLTDSVIGYASSHSPDTRRRRILDSASAIQRDAYDGFKKKDMARAIALTREAYFLVSGVSATLVSSDDINKQYKELTGQIDATRMMVTASTPEKAKVLFRLAKEKAQKADSSMKAGNLNGAQKEIDIGSLLIAKTLNATQAEK